jgi:hypothetical protein
LVRENNLIVSTLRESNGTEGVSIKYGEGYSTYYDRLLKVVNELADKDSPKVLSAWANASYNAESPLFERLATQYGERMLPFLVEQSGSDVEAVRAQATDRLGVILVHCQRLTASDKNEIHDLVVGALADPSDGPRIAAIRVLGKSGSAADIAALSSVAINDPARYPESFRAPGSRYPLRDRAQSAIEQIRSRELSEKEQRKER